MEFLIDPSMWIGLITLVILEIVLGIDNIIFIAILTDKLPPKKRNSAQMIGLSLALLMRLLILSCITWMVTLKWRPLFSIALFVFSGKDIILLLGGIFLLFKAITKLHERLENKENDFSHKHEYMSFWTVVIQIVILDAVFSLDSIITAVGIVNNLPLMITAVVIAMIVMLLASKFLTRLVNRHQTVVVLCLSFLLMISLSLIAEGFGYHIPKGYLYAAIGFSIINELFNEIARRNFIKQQSSIKLRHKITTEAIMKLIVLQQYDKLEEHTSASLQTFSKEEQNIILGILSMISCTLRSMMTPRDKIFWLDCQWPIEKLRTRVMKTTHSMVPICDGGLDNVIGIVRAKDLMRDDIINLAQVKAYASANPAMIIPDNLDVLKLLSELHRANGSMVLVSNDFGIIHGLITPIDIIKIIFKGLSEENLMKNHDGIANLAALQQVLE